MPYPATLRVALFPDTSPVCETAGKKHNPSCDESNTSLPFPAFLEETVWDILYYAVRSKGDEYQKYISNKDPGLKGVSVEEYYHTVFIWRRMRQTNAAYTKCDPSLFIIRDECEAPCLTVTHIHTLPHSKLELNRKVARWCKLDQ